VPAHLLEPKVICLIQQSHRVPSISVTYWQSELMIAETINVPAYQDVYGGEITRCAVIGAGQRGSL